MKIAMARFRSSTLLLGVLALAACGDNALAPQSDLKPQLNSVQPIRVALLKRGPAGSTATFSITATGGTLTQGSTVTLDACPDDAPACFPTEVWVPTTSDVVNVTITEIASTGGMVFNEIQANGELIGYVGIFAPAPPTITVQVSDVAGALVRFKNVAVEVPDLVVTKTAAGTYDTPVRWTLDKTVSPTSHSGTAGSVAGSSTWSVTATKIVGAPTNHQVSGTISVTNPAGAPFTRSFTVADVMDGNSVPVNCPKLTAAPGETVVCSYSVAVAGATLNTATVSSTGYPDVTANAAVSYTGSTVGDESVTLADGRFGYSQVISTTTTVTFPESFPCPSDASQYTNGTHNRTETNTATLTGNNTNLSDDATVNITCTMQQNGETATGAGFPWAATQGAPNTWFMYTPWVTTGAYRGISAAATSTMPAGTNLIAGQHYVAGRITGVRGTTTSITITLNSDWGFLNEIGNVKINPMSCTTGQPYKSPGQFTVHRSGSGNAITVSGLPNTACYGIHVDVVEK